MGALYSRWKKQPSTIEILEDIEKEVNNILKFRQRNKQLEKKYIGTLLLYSIIAYIIAALVYFFYYFPVSWRDRFSRSLPLLLFPFIVYGIKKLLHWYFVKRITESDEKLRDLREKKKKILEEVKEKETYKTAKEILEKYDPSSKPPPPQATPSLPPRPHPTGVATPGSQVRQRHPGATPVSAQKMAPGAQRAPLLPRPILSQDRGVMDKMVDYLVGDGPSNRYALICRHCYSHNGMALREEFEYLAFKCAFCGFMNPSRKLRPQAPLLPQSPVPTITSPTAATASKTDEGSGDAQAESSDKEDRQGGGEQEGDTSSSDKLEKEGSDDPEDTAEGKEEDNSAEQGQQGQAPPSGDQEPEEPKTKET